MWERYSPENLPTISTSINLFTYLANYFDEQNQNIEKIMSCFQRESRDLFVEPHIFWTKLLKEKKQKNYKKKVYNRK